MLDILPVETLKVFFGLTPSLSSIKKNPTQSWILADEKVVKSHNNVSFYQNLLISKANIHPAYNLASNLNYSVTKTINYDDKNHVQQEQCSRKTILIPVLSILLFVC
jgi:hypothetical protein